MNEKKIIMNVKGKEMEIIAQQMHYVQILQEVLHVNVMMDMMAMVLLVMVIIFCFFFFDEKNLIFTTINHRCK